MQRIVALSTPQAKKCNEIYALENRGKYDGIDSVLLGVDTMPYLYRICAESVRLHLSMPNLCVYAYSMPYQRIRNSLTHTSHTPQMMDGARFFLERCLPPSDIHFFFSWSNHFLGGLNLSPVKKVSKWPTHLSQNFNRRLIALLSLAYGPKAVRLPEKFSVCPNHRRCTPRPSRKHV